MSVVAFVIVVLIIVLGVVVAGMAIRIVPEYQRLVVLRLGRLIGVRGPGLILLIPFVDRGIRADLRERVFDVTPQSCITKDNAAVAIDFLIYSKIVDPASSVINVHQYEKASRGIAITTLRAVAGDTLLDEVLSQRDDITNTLRGKSPSTKLGVPAELPSLLRPLIEHTNAAQRATDEVTVASGTSVATGANGATATP